MEHHAHPTFETSALGISGYPLMLQRGLWTHRMLYKSSRIRLILRAIITESQ
jgi:hypothetical protein